MAWFEEEQLGFRRLRKEQQRAALERGLPSVAVTWRSVLLGLAMVVLVCVGTPLLELRLQEWLIANFHIPVAPIFLLFVLVMLTKGFERLAGVRLLTSGELLTVFSMVLVTAAIPSEGMMKFIFPLFTGLPYYATPENRYAELFHQYLPQWFWPRDPAAWSTEGCPQVVRWLYEGLPAGMSVWDVPWRVWVAPLGMFGLFIALLYMLYFSLALILRKQWDERERLPFPVAQIPLAMVESRVSKSGGGDSVAFFASRAAWLGMLLPLVMHTYNHLTVLAPALPAIPQQFAWDEQILTEPPLNAFRPLSIWFFPSIIAITFLIAREVSFSIWFFFVLMKVEMAIAIWLGYGESMTSFVLRGHTSTMITGQGEGALIVLTLFGLWLARRHLRDVVQGAWKKPQEEQEGRREVSTYRLALVGLVVSVVGMAVWLDQLGLSFRVVLPLLVLVVVYAVGLTRIAVEGGLVHVKTAGNPASLVEEMYGTRSLGPKDTTLLVNMQFGFFFEFQAFLMPSLMHALKVGHQGRLKRIGFVGALTAAVAMALVVSFAVFLWMGYTFQGNHLGFSRWPTYTSQYLSIVIGGKPANVGGLGWVGLGGALMLAMLILRQRFLWLPHPLGYVVFLSPFRINRFWLMLFLGWFFKWAVLKYFDLQTYYRARRFFLGVLVGEFTTVGLWAILDSTMFTYIWGIPSQALKILL